jgi:uncharacterized protein
VASSLNRIYDALRHPSAAAVGEQSQTVSGLEHLRGRKYCLLVTYRRNGDAVPTPVWFGIGDGKLYVRTEGDVAKVKRIRNDPRARIAPCTLRGKPIGPAAEGSARVIERGSPDEERAERALQANYGIGRRIYERVGARFSDDLVYIEVTPTLEP